MYLSKLKRVPGNLSCSQICPERDQIKQSPDLHYNEKKGALRARPLLSKLLTPERKGVQEFSAPRNSRQKLLQDVIQRPRLCPRLAAQPGNVAHMARVKNEGAMESNALSESNQGQETCGRRVASLEP